MALTSKLKAAALAIATGRSKSPRPTLAWCETVTAGPTTPMHLRWTTTGLHRGGGADGPALCGREVAWDTSETTPQQVLDSVPHQHETFRICLRCLEGLSAPDLNEATPT